MRDSTETVRRYLRVSGQPAGASFHTSQVSISFGEAIDPAALRAAWEALAQAHPALRAILDADGSVTPATGDGFRWTELDWKTAPPDDLGAAWQSLVQTDAAKPVAFGEEPAARFTFIVLPNGQGHALWSFHAALLDSDSVSLALNYWLQTYDALRTGEPAPEFPAGASPDEESSVSSENQAGSIPLLVLPLPASEAPTGTRRSIAHTFERPERQELIAAAAELGGDLRSLCGAAWSFVLARATASPDAQLLETARPTDGIGRLETFVLRRHAVESLETPADLIASFAEDSQIESLPSKIPPSYVYRDHTVNDRLQLELPRWMAADIQLIQPTALPLTLRVVASDRPEIALDYDPAMLSDEAARTLFDTFRGTLAAFTADPSLPLAEFPLPGIASRVETPDAPGSFRSLVAQSIHETFADAASESPDAIAVEMDDERLTFAQLNSAANQLARLLRKRGVEPGARIAVAMPRSPRWVVAILGALKAGAAVVPTHPDSTTADVAAWIVDQLAEGETRPQPVVQMLADAGSLANEKSRGAQTESRPDAPALVLPEGESPQTFSHETLANALQSLAGLLALTPADRVLQFAPTGTAAAIEEALAPLLSGATLILRADNRWPTRTAFQEFVAEKGVTALSIPTPFWTQWTHYLAELSLSAPSSLRVAMTTGPLPAPNAARAWTAIAGSTRWLHRTSTPACAGLGLASEWNAEDPLAVASLGRPGPATIGRLVDRHGLPVPVGFPGRVEIAPAGSPDITNPLELEALVSPEGNFYAHTLLRELVWNEDTEGGAASIRHAANSHPGVLDAHVEQRLIAARQEWCVWILPRDSERGEPHDFREWLTGRLPSAPRRIRALSRFPLDEAGHLDVNVLAEQIPDDVAAPTARKGSDLEERVRQAVSRALGGRRVDLDEILTDGRTKPQIARNLLEAVSRDEPRAELADFTTGFSVRSLLRNVRGRRSGADSAWTPIQPLRASGKLPPIVFIHDLDGTARPYAALAAQLDENQPSYAITARGLADPASSHATVEEMAAAYVQALRVFDANGPYRLAGYGFGGLVAFEVARQLTAAGAAVPMLITLATEPPASNSPAAFLAGGWKSSLASLFGRPATDESPGRRRRPTDSPVFRANQEAARKYRPGSTALDPHVFVPEREFPTYRAVQAGWNATCPGAHFYQVPCSGPEMMDEPAVESVAQAVQKLARAEKLDAELED